MNGRPGPPVRGGERLVVRGDSDLETASTAPFPTTRRELLRRGLATGGAVVAAAAVDVLLGARDAFAQASSDAGIVRAAIGLEQIAVLAYATALASGKLDAPTTKVVSLFRAQEQQHEDALTAALKGLGGTPPPKPTGTTAAGVLKGLSAARDQKAILTFAIELEMVAVGAYYAAHTKLQDAELLRTATQVMANEGQHLAVLRGANGLPPVPNAFETGKATS